MAALALDHGREPEVARFIDTYKYDQEVSSKRNKFGGGTSLPLNSDGYEDKQRALREERHADWLRQQEKDLSEPHPLKNPLAPITFGPQSATDYEQEIQKMTDRYHNKYNEPSDPVYYRVGTPEQGFPNIGGYEKQRHEQNLVRQKEYNEHLKKQREAERQKFEARRHSPQRAPQPPGAPKVDYDRNSEVAKSEDRKAYQDYMGKYQYSQSAPVKPPINYEENRKVLNEERKREYNELIEKKAKEERYWAMRGRPVTPPGGLNIGNYDRQLKETAPQKKKEYKEMLDQQQREHMYLRARQEPEVSVMDRSGPPAQYVPTKPPPGPGYRPREENEERRRQEEARHNTGKPAEVVRNPYYSSDDYETWRRKEQQKLGDEYKEFLKEKSQEHRNREWNFDQGGVLELRGDDAVQSKQRELRAERQKDYENYKNQTRSKQNRSWPEPSSDQPLITRGAYDGLKSLYDDERRKDLRISLERKRENLPVRVMSEPIRRKYDYHNPMVDAMGKYENQRKQLQADLRRDWLKHLSQNPAPVTVSHTDPNYHTPRLSGRGAAPHTLHGAVRAGNQAEDEKTSCTRTSMTTCTTSLTIRPRTL
ncbi:hypothetical protein DPMN_104813 [Dreissena polymorpha]|uniref:Uncharacterized protein n=1 Tax=Dreissena polymorpha TaxID=45954 RepID=A0A9D4K354_DREPO|nr:hypothetical protein DPMN_104813 [Dreissena polymorpha]